MARRITERDLSPILEAFTRWSDSCLIEDGSLFSRASLWTATNIEEVRAAFIEHPDEGTDDFITKLKGQMKDASPSAQQLMAEMLWALLLFPSNTSAKTKRQQVRDVWALSGDQLPEDVPLLADRVLIGIGSGGPGFNNYRWLELAFLITLTADFKRLPVAERRRNLSNYDAFLGWIAGVPQEGKRQYRHMLRYFLFPDRVERMSSNRDRRAILAAFGVAPENEVKTWDDRQLDEGLLTLRTRLEEENPSAMLDFYNPPLRDRWQEVDGRESLSADLEAVMGGYAEARRTETFGRRSAMYQRFQGLQEAFAKTASLRRRPSLKVAASAGIGNWAAVPWIGFLDSRETTMLQKGVYCVYLFREDMSGVYLTLNQGVQELTKQLGWRAAKQQLRGTVSKLRAAYPELAQRGFSVRDDIDLRAQGNLGEMYEVSTIAHKYYEAGTVPSDKELLHDLDDVLDVYSRYVDSKAAPSGDRNAWIFQANLDYFDLAGALAHLSELTWVVRQQRTLIHQGDTAFLWQAGKDAGIVAIGTVTTDPADIEQLEEEKQFDLAGDRFGGVQLRARVRVDRVLPAPLRRSTLLGHPVLSKLTVLTGPQGSNFSVTKEQEGALLALLDSGTPPIPPRSTKKDLKAVADQFAAALTGGNVSFGARHNEIVRSFIASLAAKRFVILTGLSGSGKTQLGLRFGEWLGHDLWSLVPVRPDWTGSEALFGYEDALREAVGGRRAWQVPDALKFMLRAVGDPHRPYLLVLDEMNLAHVERYFADVLSGMESEVACLPNLQEQDNGLWRLQREGPKLIPVPRNLIVVGTVNVDETTYMFSPKVLDRANTFEFRVQTNDLRNALEKPTAVPPGDPELVAGFLAISADDRWHIDHPAPGEATVAQHLRTVHELLAKAGYEFGHRVFYEALRFAAMLAAAGDDDPLNAVDLQIMQKVLPRLHGSRRRLEATLCSLGRFCYDLTYDRERGLQDAIGRFNPLDVVHAGPRLALSFDKVRRMTEIIRANQFVSFTE
jgi:hypothetical protein